MNTENPYSTPVTEVDAPPPKPLVFFAVSRLKFIVMFTATLGLYSIVWYFENWQLRRKFVKGKVRPFWRAIFQVFFTHSLFNMIAREARERKIDFKWNPVLLATAYVFVWLISNLADLFSRTFGVDVLFTAVGILTIFPMMYILLITQDTANRINDDPAGRLNGDFTAVNWVFIALGGLLWLLVILGFAAPYMGDALNFLENTGSE